MQTHSYNYCKFKIDDSIMKEDIFIMYLIISYLIIILSCGVKISKLFNHPFQNGIHRITLFLDNFLEIIKIMPS